LDAADDETYVAVGKPGAAAERRTSLVGEVRSTGLICMEDSE